MTKESARSEYAEILGEIAIEWNYLERALHRLGYAYLKGDSGVASHIFSNMGNVSKITFIEYLVERFESDQEIAVCARHFMKAFNILRENRNILEHATPFQTREGIYQSAISKTNKRGVRVSFYAPIKELKETLEGIRNFRGFGVCIDAAILEDGDLQLTKGLRHGVVALRDKLPLPRKIGPLPPQEDLTSA